MLMILISFIKIWIQKSLADTINKEIPKVTEWFNSNKLHISKTVFMLFNRRQRIINESWININGDKIPFFTHTKFIGVNIDNILTWRSHIN